MLKRLKFSNEEKRFADFLFLYRDAAKEAKNLGDYEARLKVMKNIMVDNIKDGQIREKIGQLLKYSGNIDLMEYLQSWSIKVFPITGAHIESKKIPKGPIYAKILNDLKEFWKNDLNLDTSSVALGKLLEKCDQLLAKYSK